MIIKNTNKACAYFPEPEAEVKKPDTWKTKSKLEYIWLDGYKPTQSLRGKTLVVKDFSGKVEDCPEWSFDGSSTE